MAYPTSGKKMLNICILDILKKYTDCDHTMDQKDIIAKLKEDYDITVDRKSVKANLNCLVDYGYDIEYTETEREKKDGTKETLTSNWYYNHEFNEQIYPLCLRYYHPINLLSTYFFWCAYLYSLNLCYIK